MALNEIKFPYKGTFTPKSTKNLKSQAIILWTTTHTSNWMGWMRLI